MKRLIYALYVLFVVLMGVTFHAAHRSWDGEVEPHYHEKSMVYFREAETARDLGLQIERPGTMTVGENPFLARLSTNEGPLDGARVVLHLGDVGTPDADASYALQERAPGEYGTRVDLPNRGTWLLRLEIDHDLIRTRRRWFLKVD